MPAPLALAPPPSPRLTVGPTRYCRRPMLATFSRYATGGGVFIQLHHGETGQRVFNATVCLHVPRQHPGHVWLKGWSENEGVPEALEQAGLVTLTGDRMWAPRRQLAQLARLSDRALAAVPPVPAPEPPS